MMGPAGTPRHVVLPKERGLEREAVSWFTHMYPRTQLPGWPTARPIDIIQVCFL
jgi:histone arginine demethylase JMJD6